MLLLLSVSDSLSSWSSSSSLSSSSSSSEPESDGESSIIADPQSSSDDTFDVYETLPAKLTFSQAKQWVKKNYADLWVDHKYEAVDGDIKLYYICKNKKSKTHKSCEDVHAVLIYNINQSVFMAGGEHNHDVTSAVITSKVRAYVRAQTILGTTPKNIITGLLGENLGRFTPRQITQMKQRIKRKLKREALLAGGLGLENLDLADNRFGSAELRAWCQARSQVPADETTAFVLHYNIDDTRAGRPMWSLFISNRQLLTKLTKIKCLQVDATHKIIIGKHKVFVAGGSDKNRKFHPIIIGVGSNENEDAYKDLFRSIRIHLPLYYPMAIMADGATYITNAIREIFPGVIRLMCYFHVKFNVKKWFGSKFPMRCRCFFIFPMCCRCFVYHHFFL